MNVPDTLAAVEVEKDSRRFPDSHGWGYAHFQYDAVSDALKPLGNHAKSGNACHTIVAQKEYVFTAYAKVNRS